MHLRQVSGTLGVAVGALLLSTTTARVATFLLVLLFAVQLATPLVARFVALFGQSFRAAVNAPFVAAVDAALAAEDWSRLSRGLAKALRAAQSSEIVRASSAVAAEWSALSNDVAAFDRHRIAVQVGRTVQV